MTDVATHPHPVPTPVPSTLLDIIAARAALAIKHRSPAIVSFEPAGVPNQAFVVTADAAVTLYYNPSTNTINVSVERYISLASRIAPFQVLEAYIVEVLLNLPVAYPRDEPEPWPIHSGHLAGEIRKEEKLIAKTEADIKADEAKEAKEKAHLAATEADIKKDITEEAAEKQRLAVLEAQKHHQHPIPVAAPVKK